MRERNTSTLGIGFSLSIKDLVWNKGYTIPGEIPSYKRKDKYGNIIYYSQYGNTSSEYGWEIDHIMPVSKGGTDNITNLQPLQWEENRDKADQYPYLK